MSPSWYDLLGLDPGASDSDVRAAWKAAIADLDPSDRRFRLLNQAAEVLLDPDKRAAYDEQVALEAAAEPEPEPVADPEPAPYTHTATDAASDLTVDPDGRDERARRAVPGWILVGLAVLTAVMLGVSAWLWVDVPADATVQDATTAAQAAAERAIVPVLSYDYRALDEDQAAAHRYLTPSFRQEYDKLFAALIAQNAPETKTVVTVEVVASGIVRSGADRVQVLLFVNRPTTNAEQEDPIDYKDQVTVTMVDDGGDWLVDGLQTGPLTG